MPRARKGSAPRKGSQRRGAGKWGAANERRAGVLRGFLVGVLEGPGRRLLPRPTWRCVPQLPRGPHVPQEAAATWVSNLSALLAAQDLTLPVLNRWSPPLVSFPHCRSTPVASSGGQTAGQSRKPAPSPLPGAFLDWTRKLVGGLACRGVLRGAAMGKLQYSGFGGPGTRGLGSALEPEAGDLSASNRSVSWCSKHVCLLCRNGVPVRHSSDLATTLIGLGCGDI